MKKTQKTKRLTVAVKQISMDAVYLFIAIISDSANVCLLIQAPPAYSEKFGGFDEVFLL